MPGCFPGSCRGIRCGGLPLFLWSAMAIRWPGKVGKGFLGANEKAAHVPGRRRKGRKREMKRQFIARKEVKVSIEVNEMATHCPQAAEPCLPW